MVIDSSALISVIRAEPGSHLLLSEMRATFSRLVAAPTAVEASVVMLARFGEAGLADLYDFMTQTSMEVVPFADEHMRLAVDAFRRFGRGRHPAALNFGDCFSYALSKATGEPLLFKGEDFSRTDVRKVL